MTMSIVPSKLTFTLDKDFASGAIEIDSGSNPALLAAFATGGPLPEADVILAGADVQLAPDQKIALGPLGVGFSADVNASLGLYTTAGALRAALLKAPSVISEIADHLLLPSGDKFLMLRWGYDIGATASGSVALGLGAALSVSASADTKGFFAVAHGVDSGAPAQASFEALIKSWKLPSAVNDIAKMLPRTVLISEVDGSFQLGSKVAFGYDFNWVRAVNGLGLKGDVGLKLKASLEASIGFGMTGKFALMLTRPSAASTLQMRLYKLRVRELDLGFSASVTASPVASPLPDHFDDLLKAMTGTHQQQIIKLLGTVRDWSDPSKPIFGPFVNLADTEAQKLIMSLTGVTDLAAAFETIKARIQKLFTLWDGLPQTATQFLWSKLPDVAAVGEIKDVAQQARDLSPDGLSAFLQSKIGNIAFLNSTAGQALESFAVNGLFDAIGNTAALTKIKGAAGLVVDILDGHELQTLLTNLQAAINTKLDLKRLETIVDAASFAQLDTWLKARLEDFLEQKLVGVQGVAEIEKLRDGLHAILAKADDLYDKARAAIKKQYDFTVNATYQSTSATSPLLDVAFDFSVAGSDATAGLRLALAGKFDELLASTRAGVTVNDGVLAYALHKESHVSIALPFFSTDSKHVNDAVAELERVDEDGGGLVFSLKAVDTYTSKNDYSSALTIALTAPGDQNNVTVHADSGASWRYVQRVSVPSLTSGGLAQGYAPYATTYFAEEFRNTSFSDWVQMIAPGDGRLGNSLLGLTVTLPSSAAGAWMRAPGDQRDAAYKRMSIALQRQFKQILHDVFFADIRNYKNVSGDTTARAVLAFCSIPPCSDAELIHGGDHVQFLDDHADGKTIYWDYRDRGVNSFSVDLREKVLFSAETQANLLGKLRIAQKRLAEAGDPDHVAGFYADNQMGQILGAALHGQLIDFLFPVEANMVEQARAAGLKLQRFRTPPNQFANPDKARQDLAAFGQKLSEDFNTNLKNFAVDVALLPLGTAIYTAGAVAIDPTADVEPTAMFTIATLKSGVSSLDPADVDILHTERVVHGSLG
jgi:hypothetical protein